MESASGYRKKGYLYEPFRLFHLRDAGVEEMEYHYHEFDKIVFFLSGTASYIIEGREYFLEPWDVLFVSHHLIHKPVIDPSDPYERVVLYLDPGFVRSNSTEHTDLSACFRLARRRQFALMRPDAAQRSRLSDLLGELEQSLSDGGFGSELLARICFLRLLIHLNRNMVRDHTDRDTAASIHDPKIGQALSYINENLAGDLSVDVLAGLTYTSRYYFMRRFKQLTGFSVHKYISQKRLLAAARMLRQGVSAQDACTRCGFQDYSAFHRAFRQQFGMTPRQMQS